MYNVANLTGILKISEFDEGIRNNSFPNLYIEKQRKITEYINTNEFKQSFKALKEYLKSHESFSTNGVYYTETDEEKRFADNAIQVFSTIDNNTNTHREIPEADFPTMELRHKGIVMRVTMGQGSIFSFWLEQNFENN